MFYNGDKLLFLLKYMFRRIKSKIQKLFSIDDMLNYSAFENRRSFTSVDNLSFVIEQLIEKDIPTGIYNVGDDETLSTNELIALMAKMLDKPNRTWNWNKSLIQFCARVGTVLHLPLNTERLQKLTENYVVSNAKLKQALGIEKMPVRAEDGLRKTVESF